MTSAFWGSVLLGRMGFNGQQKSSGHILSSSYRPEQSNRDSYLTEFSGNFLRITCENWVRPWHLNLPQVNPTWNIHVCPPSVERVFSCHTGIMYVRESGSLDGLQPRLQLLGPLSASPLAFSSSPCLNEFTFLLKVVQISFLSTRTKRIPTNTALKKDLRNASRRMSD